MTEYYCNKCGKKINKSKSSKGFRCPRCNLNFCKECSPIIGGIIIKRKGCPECGTQLINI